MGAVILKADRNHNRQLPTGRELGTLTRVIQARYWHDIQLWLPRARFQSPPDAKRWLKPFVEIGTPIMTAYYVRGAREAAGVLRQLLAGKHPRLFSRVRKGFVDMMVKDAGLPDLTFDVYNPLVSQAIEQATFDFARSTLDTMTTRVRRVWRDYLRQTLTQGLEAGDTLDQLARDVSRIVRDSDRAFMVAATEASRAVHAGQQMLDEQSGVVEGKKWLASADACDICLSLDGKVVGMADDFTVIGDGPYSRIPYPPAHPHCMCTYTAVLKDEY